MYSTEKKYHFYAAHRNQELIGKCSNMHGHLYRVYVNLIFPDSAVTSSKEGVSLSFEDIDSVLEPIIKGYDHATLVDSGDQRLVEAVGLFPDVFGKVVLYNNITSVENLCKRLYDQLQQTPIGIFVDYVDVEETQSTRVRYSPKNFILD